MTEVYPRATLTSITVIWCGESGPQMEAPRRGARLHGGIGITWEHDAQLYFKRAHGSAQLFGQPGEHLARMSTAAAL